MSTQVLVPTDRSATALPPLVRELPADLETPVSVYLKLRGSGPSFLLESVTGGEQLARYSFIGVRPSRAYVLHGGAVDCHTAGGVTRLADTGDPLDALRAELQRYACAVPPGLPRFSGGLVGFLGYEAIRFIEPSVPVHHSEQAPDGIFLLADTVVAFDHAFGKLVLIANPLNDTEGDPLAEAAARLDAIERRLAQPVPPQPEPAPAPERVPEVRASMTPDEYRAAVEQAKAHITAGDIFQVVLSQRLSRPTSAAPFSIYRALRRLNPSPYMFFFDFDGLAGAPDLHLIGASPELHVRLEGQMATVRPIAGTRPRGVAPAEDLALERDLLADPKERAEHVMLVDLGRNDLGRVCTYGSVQVTEQMAVERYSHVMHIVSQVQGRLKPGMDAFDLLRATFPAGTVSGAPKIRAMQIIHNLEKNARGIYSGIVGYFAADGSMDTCITIRTLVMRGSTVTVQVGAGIVADSVPENEYQETLNKARGLIAAVALAEGGRA